MKSSLDLFDKMDLMDFYFSKKKRMSGKIASFIGIQISIFTRLISFRLGSYCFILSVNLFYRYHLGSDDTDDIKRTVVTIGMFSKSHGRCKLVTND